MIKNLDEAKKAVDWYHEHGYPQIKIYNSFPKDILPRDHRSTRTARGMRVSGHIPAFLRAQDAVRAGYDEIQHINQVLLNFLVTTRPTRARWSASICPPRRWRTSISTASRCRTSSRCSRSTRP